MSLFSTKKRDAENNDAKNDASPFTDDNNEHDVYNAASLKVFKSSLQNLTHNRHYHFSTGGQWNIYELIEFLLIKTGPAHVFMSTWAIMENAVREYVRMKDEGKLLSIHAIFDYKVKDQKTNALLLAENEFSSITLAKNHSKVTVISNETWGITVFGSANQTRNPRIERGEICTVKTVADFDLNWMNAVINNESPFKVRGA